MAKKRKHRVMVDITFDEPHGQKEARAYIQGVLEGYFKLPGHKTSGVTKFKTKEGERVIRIEREHAAQQEANILLGSGF